MLRPVPLLLVAALVAACGTPGDAGLSDEQRAQELAEGACRKYSVLVRGTTRPGGAPRGMLERIAEEAQQAAELDARWNWLGTAMSDPAKNDQTIRAKCKAALAN